MNQQQFVEALKEKGINLTPKQLQQFHKYYELLVEWNEKMNLTAITDQPSVYLKHFY
ncbi:class I SAM-dependent methyltransferase, partial [Leptospira santarosai]|nr:class I SAM-dependent methyltransferase [Leptospira santarosai]